MIIHSYIKRFETNPAPCLFPEVLSCQQKPFLHALGSQLVEYLFQMLRRGTRRVQHSLLLAFTNSEGSVSSKQTDRA